MVHTRTIGVFTPLSNIFRGKNDFFTRVLQGAQDTAKALGVDLIFIEPFSGSVHKGPLARNRADGWIILCPISNYDLRSIQTKPTVSIAAHLPNVTKIKPDNRGGIRLLVDHLIHMGHERIAFIGDLGEPDIDDRHLAYIEKLNEAELAHPQSWQVRLNTLETEVAPLTEQSGYLSTKQLLQTHLNSERLEFTALVCANDLMAYGALRALKEANVRVPDDLAIVGFDDENFSQYSSPALTSIHQSFEDLGTVAVKQVVEYLSNGTPLPFEVVIPVQLIVRDSSSPKARLPQADETQEGVADHAAVLAEVMRILDSHPDAYLVANRLDSLIKQFKQGEAIESETLFDFWRLVLSITQNVKAFGQIFTLVSVALISEEDHQTALDPFAKGFLESFQEEMLRVNGIPPREEAKWLGEVMSITQSINPQLFGEDPNQAASLSWLKITPAVRGCLAILDSAHGDEEFVVAGVYSEQGFDDFLKVGTRIKLEDFPLAQALMDPANTQACYQLSTPTKIWGVLSVELPPNFPPLSFGIWANFLAHALERSSLIQIVNRLMVKSYPADPGEIHSRRGNRNKSKDHASVSDVILLFVEAGELTLIENETLIPLLQGQTVIYWNAFPNNILLSNSTSQVIEINFPLRWLIDHNIPASFTQPLLYGKHLIPSAPILPEAINQWHKYLQSENPELLQIVQLELEASVRRISAQRYLQENVFNTPANNATKVSKTGYLHAMKMARFIADHYTDELSKEEIAASVGINPYYAIRLFSGLFRESPVAYMTRVRIAHAQRLLISTELPILQVAMQSGFGSLSHFNTVFKRICNQTPSEFRKPIRAY